MMDAGRTSDDDDEDEDDVDVLVDGTLNLDDLGCVCRLCFERCGMYNVDRDDVMCDEDVVDDTCSSSG